MDDPDAPAGPWVPWVLYDPPARSSALAENVATTETLKDGAVQGRNDFPRTGYGGPRPPPGKAHRYFFKLYAPGAPLGLKPGATEREGERGIHGHVLATAQLIGTHARQKRGERSPPPRRAPRG